MIRIGTSGWVYKDWRGRFYSKDLPQRRWLEYYAQHFDTVELNATAYRLPKESQIKLWCQTAPPNFVYTVKLSRLITHRKTMPPRLDEFINNYMQRARCFEAGKVAQILVQLPPYLERNDEFLAKFLDKLPPEFRYAVEFRHKSWFGPDVEAILRERNMAFCIHDYPRMRVPLSVTTEAFSYVRLHGYLGLYFGNYPRRTLKKWAERIKELAQKTRDVYVYFNNDTLAAAPHDAAELRSLLNL